MAYKSFKELRVWQEAKALAIEVYKITAQGNITKDYGLKEQLQRAAVSVASNIAEGYERNSDKDFIGFLYMAKGSLSELSTQLEIASAIGYLNNDSSEIMNEQCDKVGAMLTKLIKSRRSA